MVAPRRTWSRRMSFMSLAPTASTPSKGSSIRNRSGWWISDAAIATRFRIPFEYSAMSFLGLSSSSNSPYRARQSVHTAHEFQELRAGEAVEQQRFIRNQSDALLDLEALVLQGHAQQL